jgi:quercetin dioxygenase-like cupin family protein
MRHFVASALLASFAIATNVFAADQPKAGAAGATAVRSADIIWTDAPPPAPAGAKSAVLEGNPRAAGMFTMRVKMPAGSALPPHWHPRAERVTVLSGSVELGFGTTADRAKAVRYETGSFYVNPPRTMHYLFFPEETMLQLTCDGPWELYTTDVTLSSTMPTASIRLNNVRPTAESKLTASDTIQVDVEYEITGFRPDSFFLMIHFDTPVEGRTMVGPVRGQANVPPAPPRQPALATARGKATVSTGLEYLFDGPMLRHPVRFRVYLHETTGETDSRVIAKSDPIDYAN